MKEYYDTGKVKIGLAYERPLRVEMSADAHALQRGLLGKGKPMRPEWTGDTLLLIVASILFFIAIYLFNR